MKETILQPSAIDPNVLVQFTQTVEVTKHTMVKVPTAYRAFAYINEKMEFRIEPCDGKYIKDYDKQYIGKNIKIAYIMPKALPAMKWGFGNINVNNERIQEAYRVGANGSYIIEIIDFVKLISNFVFDKEITVEMVREKSISGLKTVGIPILADCFSKTEVSVFEINSLIGQIREKMIAALKEEAVFSNLGIKINSLTIDGIHVNEEDLAEIRNRINA